MGWLAEILEGSRHRISKGQYHSTYGEDRIWDEPSTSMGAWWDSGNEDINGAFAHPFSEEDRKGKRVIDYESHFEEDDQLAKDLQENLTLESPPQYDYGNLFQPYPYFYPPGYRTCAGCNTQIGPTGFLSCMGAVWHPECFRCYACNLPISDYEFSLSENSPFHKHCYRKQHHPRCDVCKNSIPTNMAGLIEYRAHPFWTQKYCPSHEYDRTPRCCSCERMEGYHHMPETRGLCLSEERTIKTISRRPRIGAGYRITDLFTEPYRLLRRCEVTAILILYGLPRLLTGSILAHEMMHAWLRLKGYPNLSPDVEEGICQVLAHMWLDSEIYGGSGSDVASTSSSSASSSGSTHSKKGKRSQFEKKLGEFFKNQIESDTSETYGDGFRAGNQAVLKYGLKRTLDHIRLTGSFPC